MSQLGAFLSAALETLTVLEVVLLIAGAALIGFWSKLPTKVRVAGVCGLLIFAVLNTAPSISRSVSEGIKVMIAASAAGLALIWRELDRKVAHAVLIVLTLVGTLNFLRWGPKFLDSTQIDPYDVIHYYMSARYFDEVGYYDLYPALLLADREHPDGPHNPKMMSARLQVDGVYRRVPMSQALAAGREARENFSEARWESFKSDFYVLQRDFEFDRRYWAKMMDDRGFNGTPAFLLVAKPLVNLCPAANVKYLCMIDVLLLALMLWLVRWAYDTNAALWCLLFLSLTYSLRWPVPGDAFLRYDWVVGLVVATCLLKKLRPGLAGVALGWATVMRMFPAVWLLGPAVKGVFGLFGRGKSWAERLDRRLLTLAGAFFATVLVMQGAATLSVGREAVATHAENISEHTRPEQLSSNRMGLALAMSYDGSRQNKYISDERKQLVAEQKPRRTFWAALMLLGLGWGLRRRRDDEAFAYGLIPFFLLATASYYYYVARLTLILIHAQGLSRKRDRVGLAILMGLEAMTNFLEVQHGSRVVTIGYLSWGMTAYAVVMIAWLMWDSYKGRDLETAAQTGPQSSAAKAKDNQQEQAEPAAARERSPAAQVSS